MMRRLWRALVRSGVAGMVLATPLSGQGDRTRDSLGLLALNEQLHLLTVPLSIDLTRGQLRAAAPNMQKIGLGPQHAVWGIPRRRTGLSTEFVFAADDGGIFERSISDASPLVAFGVNEASDDVDSMLVRAPAYDAMRRQLGPPDFCERDTILFEKDDTFVVRLEGAWIRGDAVVLLNGMFDLRDEPNPLSRFRPRFSQMLLVFRNSDTLMRRSVPVRHDAPCFLTAEEIRSYRTPLSDEAYRRHRETLRTRPPRPFRYP